MAGRLDQSNQSLDSLTRKWWIYTILLILFFIPAYTSKSYNPQQTANLVEAVLRAPLINAVSNFYFILKILPIVIVILLLSLGNRIRRLFYCYVMILFVAIALFQNSAYTEQYGFVLLISNVVYMLIAALAWLYALIKGNGDFEKADPAPWKWPLLALALFAFWFPVNESTIQPDFNLAFIMYRGDL
jgi:hypothetical protein